MDKIKRFFQNDLFLMSILYFFACGIMLLNKGLFFDDWFWFKAAKADFTRTMTEAGLQWCSPYIAFLLSFDNMLVCRIAVFLAFLFSGFLLNSILTNVKEIDRGSRFFIVLFFLIFPVNFAKIALCTSHYALCVFVFFLGFWLLAKYLENNNVFVRLACLAAMFFSFFTNSLLVFYAVILIYIMYARKVDSIKSFFANLLRYADFFILPVVFFAFRMAFLKPHGLYASYNVITLRNLIKAPFTCLWAFETSFLAPIDASVRSISFRPFLMFGISFLLFLSLNGRVKTPQDDKRNLFFLFLGFFFFLLGVFPYLSVGLVPSLYDWGSRHQLLVPLGASFIFYYGLSIFANTLGLSLKIRGFLCSVFIVLFIASSFTGYLEYQKDWFKQISLIKNFSESKILQDNTSFIFNDKTTALNARKRRYRFYEYTALMKRAFGNERRFGAAEPVDFDNVRTYRDYGYNMKEFDMQKPQYEVTIDYGTYQLKNSNVIRLLLLEALKPEAFESKIKSIVTLKYEKL